MSTKTRRKDKGQGGLELSADALRGKQSVRATFTLPKQLIDLLSIVSAQLGIKQKSLFDQLVEDINVLQQVAGDARNYSPRKRDRRQKTFVLSRRSLLSLDLVASQQQLPRDILVEFSIRRLQPIINAEREKHQRRKELMEKLEQYLEAGGRLQQEAERSLGADDALCAALRGMMAQGREARLDLAEAIERGEEMEKLR